MIRAAAAFATFLGLNYAANRIGIGRRTLQTANALQATAQLQNTVPSLDNGKSYTDPGAEYKVVAPPFRGRLIKQTPLIK